jgi:small lipoprotein (TIGR04452 family)
MLKNIFKIAGILFFISCNMMNVENDGLISGKKAKMQINALVQAYSPIYISGVSNMFTSGGANASSCNQTSTGTTPTSGTTDSKGNLYYVASDSGTFDKALPITLNPDTTKSTFLTGTLSSSRSQDIFYYNASKVSNATSYYIYLNAQNSFGLEQHPPNPAPPTCKIVDETAPESSTNTTGYFRNSTTIQTFQVSQGQYNSYSTALLIPPPSKDLFVEIIGKFSGSANFAAYFPITQTLSQHVGDLAITYYSYDHFAVVSPSLLSNANLNTYSPPGQMPNSSMAASVSSGYYYTVLYNYSFWTNKFCIELGNYNFTAVPPICYNDESAPDDVREGGFLSNTVKPVYMNDTVNDVASDYEYLKPIQMKGHTYIRCRGSYSVSLPYTVQISTQKPEKVIYFSQDYSPVFTQNFLNAMSGSGGISTGNSALDSILSPIILNATSGIDDHKVYKKSSLDSCIANLKAKIPATYEANLALLSNTLKCGTSSTQINPTMVAGLNCRLQESGIFQLTKDIGF